MSGDSRGEKRVEGQKAKSRARGGDTGLSRRAASALSRFPRNGSIVPSVAQLRTDGGSRPATTAARPGLKLRAGSRTAARAAATTALDWARWPSAPCVTTTEFETASEADEQDRAEAGPGLAWDRHLVLQQSGGGGDKAEAKRFRAVALAAAGAGWRMSMAGFSDKAAEEGPVGIGCRSGATSRFFRKLAGRTSIAKAKRTFGLPVNHETASQRAALRNAIIEELFDGKTHLAPLDRPRRVVDVGTGAGLWAIEFARRNPASAVLGIDVYADNLPTLSADDGSLPPNCRFLVRDATETDWNVGTKFDYAHVHSLRAMSRDARKALVRGLWKNVNPGGVVEISDWTGVQSPDNSLDKTTALLTWMKLVRQGLDQLGIPFLEPPRVKSMLLNAGFCHLVETKLAAPLNPCYPGKKCQRIGFLMQSCWESAVDPLSEPILTEVLGMTPAEAGALMAHVKKELGDTRYHCYATLYTVYCKKPYNVPGSDPNAGRCESS